MTSMLIAHEPRRLAPLSFTSRKTPTMAVTTGKIALMERSTWKAICGGSCSAFAARRAMKNSSLDRTLAALADPNRRAAVQLLRRKPRHAGELSEALAMSPPAMSRHLRVLRRGGVIADEALADDARVRLYRLRPEVFATLRGWLD